MKKTLLLLLSVTLLVSFTGCSLPESNTPQSTTLPSTSEMTPETTEETDTTFEQKPMIAVSLPVIDQAEYAEDGTKLFQYSYRNMSLIVPDPEVADKVIVDFLNRIDQTADHADQILQAAKSAYAGSSQWTPYLCQIGYDPMRMDAGVLSLMGSYTSYSGTPHPEKSYLSVNYDLLTGNVLSLDDILTEDSAADTLYQYIIEDLNLQKGDKFLYEGFESTVRERFDLKNTNDTCWYFSQTGLCFYFSPYEIAPYSSGVIIVEVPYSKLTGILDDAYFPSEAEYGSGSIFTETFSEHDLDRFTQFSEVVLDNSGNKSLLYTEGVVNQIMIETGSWDANGTEFIPEYTVFAAYSLTPGDAIMVESAAANKLPNLRLSYSTADGTVHSYIVFEGEPQKPVLTEEP